jgi:hypothetical protein
MHNVNLYWLDQLVHYNFCFLYLQLIDRFPEEEKKWINFEFKDKHNQMTCSRSFNMGWIKRLYKYVEPAGETIHNKMIIFIQ